MDHALATREPGSVRLYGEMVAVLWQQGDEPGALALEAMWRDYLAKRPMPLLCTYPQRSLDGHRDSAAVLAAHDHVFPETVD